jgi:hypothetical protein
MKFEEIITVIYVRVKQKLIVKKYIYFSSFSSKTANGPTIKRSYEKASFIPFA